jgi:16S rRNA (guanine527-N7)-methyltransferase
LNPASEEFLRALRRECRAVGLVLSESEAADFARLWGLLERWSVRVNLTGLRKPEDAARVLFAESLLLEKFSFLLEGEWLDVGSGAGFPALPLARRHAGMRFTLVEARQRKAAFLREAALLLRLGNVRVTAAPLSEAASSGALSPPYAGATLRGVRLTPALWRTLAPLLAPGASLALYTARRKNSSVSMREFRLMGKIALSGQGEILLWRGEA